MFDVRFPWPGLMSGFVDGLLCHTTSRAINTWNTYSPHFHCFRKLLRPILFKFDKVAEQWNSSKFRITVLNIGKKRPVAAFFQMAWIAAFMRRSRSKQLAKAPKTDIACWQSNSHKSNNRLSRRSIQVLFSIYSIVFNPSWVAWALLIYTCVSQDLDG